MSQQPIPPTPVPALDLDNIQGDILSGLPKKTQTYFFFQITNSTAFRSQLLKLVPLIETTSQVLKDRKEIDDHRKRGDKTLIPMAGVNIAFSHKGFITMGVDDSTLTGAADGNFKLGQKADAESLGDKGTGSGSSFVPDWDPAFLQDIHGIILISGESHGTVDKKFKQVKQIFNFGTQSASIKEITTIVGDVRPDKFSGHEHFGFLDGISNPAIIGFDKNPPPVPTPVPAGSIVTGHQGDPVTNRPAWQVDGSFLAFRYLFQQVPEFNTFLKDHPVSIPGLTKKEGSELLGARLVGRWKSGAPIDLTPFQDDPKLAADHMRNNNFTYAAEGNFQKICPFAAHTRKTNPRADLESLGISLDNRRITRRGIQFGPEVTKEEQRTGKTAHGRGLLFACYQSNISTAFAFIQKSWANAASFPPGAQSQVPGLDPLIGQGERKLTGTNPNDPSAELSLPDFIISKGGEYFFAPSISGLKGTIAAAA